MTTITNIFHPRRGTGVIICCLLFLSGCKTGDFSRYPSVSIPQYYEEEYYRLLFSPSRELVYNAVCILGTQAEDIAKTLTDEKIDKNSTEFQRASSIYKKMTELLADDDPRVVAASLRFFELFCGEYPAPEELLKPVLGIRSSNPVVLFEQAAVLSLIADPQSPVPDELIWKFLSSPSWVVSRNAYLLINSLERQPLRLELISKYRRSTDEKEKLLILTALSKNFSGPVEDFLLGELVSTENVKIRRAIFDILENAKDPDHVLQWLADYNDEVMKAEGEYLFSRHTSSMVQGFSSRLLIVFLNKGFQPDQKFFTQLNEELGNRPNADMLTDDEKEKLSRLLAIEKAVEDRPKLAESWKAIRDQAKKFDEQLNQFQKEYDGLSSEFSSKIDDLLKKYDVPKEKRQEFLKSVPDSRDRLKNYLAK